MTVRLGPLLVEAVDPVAVESFWAAALGVPAQRALVSFRQEQRPKTVKNRVHLDVYARDIAPLLDLGARVLARHAQRVTLADIEGNEFCAFADPAADDRPPARVFAVCTDSDKPEELAAWWAGLVGAEVRDGPDGTPRWLYGCAGWEGLIWKFVRVVDEPLARRADGNDERVVPNRWQWTLRADPSELGVRRSPDGALIDPQGNEFSVAPRTYPAG
ncbi:VOC family protein [Mycobacterium sp.]|uniref:VOC family protein n=1 Tax=Mycobacterium sp. TaxID=1785 RepID=UPI002D82FE91|nr:VOC family protein [Mycobacterium sp.]